MENSDLNLILEDIIFDSSKLFETHKPDDDTLKPSLRTGMPAVRASTLKEHLLALKKRNLSAPTLQGVVDYPKNAQDMVENFVSSYVSLAHISIFRSSSANPIYTNAVSTND
ncbi:unnamed protein product [Ceutorhynchus assimilis]|uniref:RNA-dependent RNA polymerase alsuviricetes domain-containing protein n=1 Tax=Ceutorhynchus assimilis TaxID=467358 RepID=A0A9N9N1B6_9CUCU|nr:unnamed protein product [Ceutorhynchus assimilis]